LETSGIALVTKNSPNLWELLPFLSNHEDLLRWSNLDKSGIVEFYEEVRAKLVDTCQEIQEGAKERQAEANTENTEYELERATDISHIKVEEVSSAKIRERLLSGDNVSRLFEEIKFEDQLESARKRFPLGKMICTANGFFGVIIFIGQGDNNGKKVVTITIAHPVVDEKGKYSIDEGEFIIDDFERDNEISISDEVIVKDKDLKDTEKIEIALNEWTSLIRDASANDTSNSNGSDAAEAAE